MYRWKSENNGRMMVKWLLYRTETVNNYVWKRQARMEIYSNLKTSGRFFQVFARNGFGCFFFFFQYSFDFVSLVVQKQFMHEHNTCTLIYYYNNDMWEGRMGKCLA